MYRAIGSNTYSTAVSCNMAIITQLREKGVAVLTMLLYILRMFHVRTNLLKLVKCVTNMM